MAFLKVQKLVYNDDGTIKSGSASIVEAVYQEREHRTGAGHSKQVVREKLGRVLYLSKDKKSGIFLSPTRGLVTYDVTKNEFTEANRDDPRIGRKGWNSAPIVHKVFGDAYLLLLCLKNTGMIGILREAFPEDGDYELVLAHFLCDILRNGGGIHCDDFMEQSFASLVLGDAATETPGADAKFYALLGENRTRTAFFRAFFTSLREKGEACRYGCYVDTIPLPGRLTDNPFQKLSAHGAGRVRRPVRLAIVQEKTTGYLVWFDVIPWDVGDLQAAWQVMTDVSEALDLETDSLALDSAYVSEDLAEWIHQGTKKSMIARLPDRMARSCGFRNREVWEAVIQESCQFRLNGHV